MPPGRPYLTITCKVCGKATRNGRLPREGRHTGDGSERFPRRHSGPDGEPCAGNIEFGVWGDADFTEPGFRVKCVTCGKLTWKGRRPREGMEVVIGNERHPIRHRGADGRECPGVRKFGERVDP